MDLFAASPLYGVLVLQTRHVAFSKRNGFVCATCCRQVLDIKSLTITWLHFQENTSNVGNNLSPCYQKSVWL